MARRILFHLNQVGYGGTEKAILTFCENLDRERFTPYLYIYNDNSTLKQLRYRLMARMSKKHHHRYHNKFVASRARLADFERELGTENISEGNFDTWHETLETVRPHIVHFNRGKWNTAFDAMVGMVPAQTPCIETNIFGYPCSDSYHDRLAAFYFVSGWLRDKSPWSGDKGRILYNPIKAPANDRVMRETFGIPADALVLGRISRPDLIDDDFILDVFEAVEHPDAWLLILAGSSRMREAAADNERIVIIDATTSEDIISGFYNSIDMLLHYRIDGETFGMNIAEAMMHGKAVISHRSEVDNAQAELLATTGEYGEVGIVTAIGDKAGYSAAMQALVDDPARLQTMSANAAIRAAALYREDVVTHYLEQQYDALAAD